MVIQWTIIFDFGCRPYLFETENTDLNQMEKEKQRRQKAARGPCLYGLSRLRKPVHGCNSIYISTYLQQMDKVDKLKYCSSKHQPEVCFVFLILLSEPQIKSLLFLYNITLQIDLFSTLSSWHENISLRMYMSHLAGSSIICTDLINKRYMSMSF